MTTVKATFDGHTFVPQAPVDLPVGFTLDITIPNHTESAMTEESSVDSKATESTAPEKPLVALMRLLDELPTNSDLPVDMAAQHDHYLYGLPKNPENDPH